MVDEALLMFSYYICHDRRLKIALGVGSAIEYLHGLYRPLRHGNIRADNVMLDELFNAKLGGFDAAASSKGSLSDDVLAFGALLLELVRGRRCQTTASACCTNHQAVNAAILDYDDQCLDGQFDREEVQRVMLVGLWCSHPDKWQRPTMAQALRYLMSEDPLPTAITEQASKSVADFWTL
ncbi:L-type lectin-domain containing receptor kinase VIII.1-like [Sorghum bicolor]|uniref:L-type lectin-domain containing receptor kinase VIII.1-like n=1 Tax=Sorghum bicolor TaxID=4558 RepID=UPI000B426C70|nr:L-type lectin-domain containing receptor kinase VIII.1-like [Sorghum bicolor]|eukprot:XP_021309190.1 L-type lectin-domain containing receptor kinase VIII.1-like [Sorghum bicolor]